MTRLNLEMIEWIETKDNKPPIRIKVLAVTHKNKMIIGFLDYYDQFKTEDNIYTISQITWWSYIKGPTN